MKTIIAFVSLLTLTACAIPERPTQATGPSKPVNSLPTAEMLAHDAGYMLVGPKRESKEVKQYFLYKGQYHTEQPTDPSHALLLNRPADRADFAEVPGARMVERTVRVPFEFASTLFRPTPQQQFQIQQLSAVADRIEVRGRTDGKGLKGADERVARLRAEAAKRYLLDSGLPSNIIAVSYQAAGDYIADNHRSAGRGMNRRVELEFYIDDFTVTRNSRALELSPLKSSITITTTQKAIAVPVPSAEWQDAPSSSQIPKHDGWQPVTNGLRTPTDDDYSIINEGDL